MSRHTLGQLSHAGFADSVCKRPVQAPQVPATAGHGDDLALGRIVALLVPGVEQFQERNGREVQGRDVQVVRRIPGGRLLREEIILPVLQGLQAAAVVGHSGTRAASAKDQEIDVPFPAAHVLDTFLERLLGRHIPGQRNDAFEFLGMDE